MNHVILVCREGYESALAEEISLHLRLRPAEVRAGETSNEPGLLNLFGRAAEPFARPKVPRPIFARQWLRDAVWIAVAGGSPPPEAALAVLDGIERSSLPWTIHAFASNPESPRPLTHQALALRDALLDFCRRRRPACFARCISPQQAAAAPKTLVLQMCLTPGGLWQASMSADELLDAYPGGVHRMRFDPLAPSRSYLKIEEAFDLMRVEPRRGERAVDLGAAPGGWTHALLKRGCAVLAVDRGPLKLKSAEDRRASVAHVRRDGVSYEPPRHWLPVDWLVSDMLVPPGKTLGMLRRWVEGRWMRRFVVNVKLPQDHPFPVLQPIEQFLRETPGLVFRIRQLYHDRREVTIMGELRARERHSRR